MSDLYAEDLGHYWQTSRASLDSWLEKTGKLIEKHGGAVLREAVATDEHGRSAIMMQFTLEGDEYRVIWPILPSRTGKRIAAKVQAATMMHHDVKNKLVSSKVLGARKAFFAHLLLPDGRTTSEVALPELTGLLPTLSGRALLTDAPPL